MSARTSRKRPAAAVVTAEDEEAAEESEQDDVTDGEPDGADEAGSDSARRLIMMAMVAQLVPGKPEQWCIWGTE
jgi:hypothetical protein